MASYSLINNETGEIESKHFQINTLEDIQRKKKFTDKKKSENEFKKFIDENLGNFYFLFYKLIKKGIQKQYIIRFLYLCTYMDYENKLLFGNAKGDGQYMIEKDLQEVLRLSERETRNTKNALIKNKLILSNENKQLSINEKYCLKGKIKNNKIESNKVRIFESGIKELYKKSKPKEHKKLALLIEILPYVNLKYNIICKNPNCEKMENIQPINLTKLSQLMGYSNNKTSTQKLRRNLFNITVNEELVIMINSTAKGNLITINPRVYYKGTKIEDVTYLLNLFKLSKKL